MRKGKIKEMGNATLLLIFSLGALLTLVCVLTVMAALAFLTPNPMGLVKPLALLALTVSAALSGFVSAKITKTCTLPCLSALIISLLLLGGGIILKAGMPSVSTLLNAVIYMAASALFAYLGTKERKRRRRR